MPVYTLDHTDAVSERPHGDTSTIVADSAAAALQVAVRRLVADGYADAAVGYFDSQTGFWPVYATTRRGWRQVAQLSE
ncbi:MAG: hypothetical protein ACYCQK_01560 [Acidiferrobacteraceae bacterium]